MAKILLADNDPVDLRDWSNLLRGEGYEVVTADSPFAADAVLTGGGLDLAILDLHMETMSDSNDLSGLWLAEKHYRSVVIIILTGLVSAEAALQALHRYGGSSTVYKVCLKSHGPKPLLKVVREITAPKVFLSHGQNLDAAATVCKFLEDGGIKVIVLREQAGQGQTILQKFEANSHVNFAIILITPDDEGRLKGGALRPRARQNVIFELGFFLGRLDRGRVTTLCQGKIESYDLPSDYDGVQKIEIDPAGGWRAALARELKAAGIRINPDALLRG